MGVCYKVCNVDLYENEEDAKFHAVIAADIKELKLLYLDKICAYTKDDKSVVQVKIDHIQERIKQHARFFADSQARKLVNNLGYHSLACSKGGTHGI